MTPFIHPAFLLETEEARDLYTRFAAPCPILDYHSHLNPKEIAQNAVFENLTQAWLSGDHYKWRAMRTCGIKEDLITGKNTGDYEKFLAWASVVPKLYKNPLYHWTHLELKAYFGIDELLSPESAKRIWDAACAVLKTRGGARDLLRSQHVEVVCTTDDPCDSLANHRANNSTQNGLKIYPTWRPDKAMKIANPADFNKYIARLEAASMMRVESFADFLCALQKRHDFFAENGCRISDYSIESFAPPASEAQCEALFKDTCIGNMISDADAAAFASGMLIICAKMDAAKDWVRQLHIGALRNPNVAMFSRLGPDTGFDAIADFAYAKPLAEHLSLLAQNNALPRTILYNLNPKENTMLATLCGSFQDGTPGGRVNWGAAWWFLDQIKGMREQLETLAQLGCLMQFPGMLTDSRSVLSMPRHDYFRRILCAMLGDDLHHGVIPNDREAVGEMVHKMCYANAKNYFNF